jgi:hypothetical protein
MKKINNFFTVFFREIVILVTFYRRQVATCIRDRRRYKQHGSKLRTDREADYMCFSPTPPSTPPPPGTRDSTRKKNSEKKFSFLFIEQIVISRILLFSRIFRKKNVHVCKKKTTFFHLFCCSC